MTNQVSVLTPYPVDKAYDYAVPEGMTLAVGDYVHVPLGGRVVTGVVWGAAEGHVNPEKIKPITLKLDLPPMPDIHRQFITRVARYTMTPLGSVLKMSMSAPDAFEPLIPLKGYKIAADFSGDAAGISPKHRAVLEVLKGGKILRPTELAHAAGCTPAVLKTIEKNGLIEAVNIPPFMPCQHPDFTRKGAALSDAQHSTAQHITGFLRAGGYHAALLDGVTGAGKTEVYFEGVAEALKNGKQVLILLPEIALSNAFLGRFESRFGCAPALWHSGLTQAQRRNTWRGVADGTIKVVVGARSALFLPYPDLGLIIVDEEHDPAYKQEEGVLYHARDMAVLRAHLGTMPIILVSATPSLETIHNAWSGRYEHLHLPDRFGGAHLPDIALIDMRNEKLDARHFLSASLQKAMTETLEARNQVLLFLNRRGYAPLTLCRTCGHRMECPRCTAWLVEHRGNRAQGGTLDCHHCGYHSKVPDICPACADTNSFVACGPGIERIMDETTLAFPEARILMLASDTTESNDTLRDMLDDIRTRKYDIVIGTQIIAKGHHFPHLTLVGVVDADLGLQGGELRAAERTYQLLHQVAGRAGREEHRGRVLLQTYMPEHRIMQAMAHGARDPFLEVEAFEREQAHMPPYSRLAGVIVSGRDEVQVKNVAGDLGRNAPRGEGFQVLGPAPAPFAKLRGKFRYRLLVQAEKGLDIQKTLAHWVSQIKTPSTVRIQIDIDPQSFF